MVFPVISRIIFVCYILVGNSYVSEKFKQYEIQPDLLPVAPNEKLTVKYPTVDIDLGTKLPAATLQAANAPDVSYINADPDGFYILLMIDPDVPTRNQIKLLHWEVGNIPGYCLNVPGDCLSKGDEVATYLTPTPPLGTGDHRYTFLLYLQNGRIQFGEEISNLNRVNFSLDDFTAKYGLGIPVAGNFFLGSTIL